MDAARYAAGETFEEFIARAVKYQDLWTLGARRATVPADVVERLAVVREPVRLAVLNEDWCLDAIGVVPYAAKLAEENAMIELRNFGRDANADLMDAHLTNGGRSIPALIAYDAQWREIGWWGPRPSPLQTWVLSEGIAMPSDEKYREIRKWYARDHGATALREIADMILAGLSTRESTGGRPISPS